MQNSLRITQLIRRAVLTALLSAPVLGAQGKSDDHDRRNDAERRLYTWRGTVDDDTRISMRAGNIQSTVVSGDRAATRGRVDRVNVLPRRDGMVRVELIEGRGTVQVIQQPNAANSYTLIVQIKDAPGGAARYRFATYFDPTETVGRRGRVVESVGGDVRLNAGQAVFRWSGNVDGDLRITLRRGQVGYEVLAGENPRNVSSNVHSGGLPAHDARLALATRQGRGTVAILQQPSSLNGYTAIIGVRDAPSGFGYYDFDLIWR